MKWDYNFHFHEYCDYGCLIILINASVSRHSSSRCYVDINSSTSSDVAKGLIGCNVERTIRFVSSTSGFYVAYFSWRPPRGIMSPD